MDRRKTVGRQVVLFGAWGALSVVGVAKADPCAKVTVHSAATCDAVRADFDVSGCDDRLATEVKIRCAKDSAEVRVSGKKNRYRAKLKPGNGAWGGGEWTLVGAVEVNPKTPRAPEKKEEKTAAAKPVVAPPAEGSAAKPESAPSVPPATSAPAAPAGAWSFSALFDGYYSYNFNQPPAPSAISAGSSDAAAIRPPQNSLRPYDWYSRQFSLNLVEFSPKYVRKEVSFFADLDFGQMADINAATASGSGYAVDEVSKHIGQAVLSFTPVGAPNLVIEIGKMATHLGLEVMKAKDNWNYSRSVNYGFGIPIWHAGVHVGYAVVPSRLAAGLYVYNGWNTITDVNSVPTLGAQLKFTPSDAVSLIYNYIGGPEQAGNNSNRKQVHEVNATLGASSQLTFGLELLTGSEEGVAIGAETLKATWSGGSLAAKWQASPSYFLSPRFEVYHDDRGYTVGNGAQTIYTYTLTNAFQIAEGLETRLEGRLDHSTVSRFATRTGTSNDQATALVALLYTIQ